jgi:DNA polymerase-3 subunit gamma/tau
MSLYQKYRPQQFDEMIGNADIISYLEEVVSDEEECPHVFLFHGPTGCGKTTLARILSEKLGCDVIDMKEVNTADFRGIDTVREMIKSSAYKGIGGGSRVWLIDETHKMTNDAQNALLKLLEDCPEHAYFILCTTDPNKLLKTVRGRCIELQVKSLTDHEMFRLLKTVVKSEDKKLKKSVYDQIIQDSQGLPRNALQSLEKVLKVSPEQQLEIAKQSAQELNESIELCRALLTKSSWKTVREILKGLKDQDPESIRRHVLGYAQSVLLNKESNEAAHVIEEFYEPLYNVGFPGLVYACYSVIKG